MKYMILNFESFDELIRIMCCFQIEEMYYI